MRRQTRNATGRTSVKTLVRQEFDSLSDNTLLSTHEVAELLNVSAFTLKSWRYHDEGPVSLKLGRSLRYAVGDLRAWLADRRKAS